MPEFRKDYVLDRWVIIAPERGKRPFDFKKPAAPEVKKTCQFCPGNEEMTPKEIMRFEKKGKWLVRVIPNKYVAVSKDAKAIKEKGLTSMPAVGSHEVVIETPSHKKQLWDLDIKQIVFVLEAYIQRISSLKGYTLVFKNHGRDAGTSVVHSHTQLISSNKIPPFIEEKLKAVKGKKCPYCQMIKKERNSKRMIAENKSFIAIAPYASRFPMEAWILPKKHIKSIVDVDDLTSLSKMLKMLLLKLKKINASYNFYIHNAPKGKDLHFMIEIAPRLATWAGFELGSDIIVNVLPPEKAALFYRSSKA
ncbi:MAG: DUF4921 family protein [Candidatus Woesearchaeota archaeon]